jgi:hypothetical protein
MPLCSLRHVLVLLGLVASGCSSSDSSGAAGSAASAAVANVVFNEFNATGSTEWLEIGNKGDTSIDLSDYAIADTDKKTGLPKTADAMRFPAGTTLEAGAHLLIVTNQSDSSSGPYTSDKCVDGCDASCYHATFGVSAKNGEAVHLLGPDNTTLLSTEYPKNLETDGSSGLTVCRIPDLTGDFALCTGTPGAANAQ